MFGGVLITSGLILGAFAANIGTAYVGLGVLCGAGGGCVLATSYIVINQYFKEKRSKAFAISTMGMGIGALTFAPVLAYWFDAYGYTGALLRNGGLFLNLQVAGALMRPPPKGSSVVAEKVEAIDVKDEAKDKSLVDLIKSKASMIKLLTNPTFMLFCLNVGCATLPSYLTFFPAYALEIGVSTGNSSLILSANGLADIIGRLGSGFFFDRVVHGRKRLYHSLVGVAAGLVVASCSLIDSVRSLFGMTMAQGFIEGIFSAQRTVVPFEFVDAKDMSDAVGLIIFAECIGTIVGPLMQGFIKDSYGSHALGFAIGGMLFCGTSFIMLMDYVIRTIVWRVKH